MKTTRNKTIVTRILLVCFLLAFCLLSFFACKPNCNNYAVTVDACDGVTYTFSTSSVADDGKVYISDFYDDISLNVSIEEDYSGDLTVTINNQAVELEEINGFYTYFIGRPSEDLNIVIKGVTYSPED